MSEVLDRVNSPEDVKSLSVEEMEKLAGEIRQLIIQTVSRTGGHLAANLGVVELTLALLKVFSPPEDKLIWDVSHQTYTYKILTGRKDRFSTLRQAEGLSGFLKREESDCDAFGAGHSGTSLSAALGMAVARDQKGQDEQVVAILGDGSAGCGISYEAFNNVVSSTQRFIVVLNDNEMSIAANVGAMSKYLGAKLASPRYNRWKRAIERGAHRMHMGWFRKAYYRLEEAIKGLFLRSLIFEEFGLRYIGPIDGHNIHALIDALAIARESDRPIILHVATKKGKGYSFAEAHPEKWHGTPGFNVDTGLQLSSKSPSYSTVFGQVLERMAAEDSAIVAITAAMPAGTGLSGFAERFPDRFFDVGISEEHAAIFAAGLAAGGQAPFFAVYSTFFQRTVDCVIHDICLQKLPVVLCLDRAGVVGDDGPTHHGVFDIALLRSVPGLVIMQPKDEAELAHMLFTARRLGKPVALRYPRGGGSGASVPEELCELELGKAEVIRTPTGDRDVVWIWALGDMLALADAVATRLQDRGRSAGVVNARFIRPLDTELFSSQVAQATSFVTLENGTVVGGFGSMVSDAVQVLGFRGDVIPFGWPDEFIPHGESKDLMARYGLTPDAIADRILATKD